MATDQDANQDNYWDELARRCWMSRPLVKKVALLLAYSGSYDPWVDHIVRTEAKRMLAEAPARKPGPGFKLENRGFAVDWDHVLGRGEVVRYSTSLAQLAKILAGPIPG
jgi:hypothetical protein